MGLREEVVEVIVGGRDGRWRGCTRETIQMHRSPVHDIKNSVTSRTLVLVKQAWNDT